MRDGRPGLDLLIGLVGRVAWFVATLCGVVALVLGLLWMAPGDPIDLLPNADDVRDQLEKEWNLDKPFIVRYLLYLKSASTGDLGISLVYRPGMPVNELIFWPAMRSLGWVLSALTLTAIWGTGLAWFTAGRRAVSRGLVQALSIAPVFLLAHLSVNLLNSGAWALMEAGRIDRPEWFALPMEDSPVRTLLAILILAVGSGALAEVHAEVENALVRIRTSGFVDAARARGAAVWRHVALNLIPPLTTVLSSRAAFFVGGLVILEKVLLLNGVGAILWRAALGRDYDLALGISLVTAALVATARLLGDIVRLVVDPRLRRGATT